MTSLSAAHAFARDDYGESYFIYAGNFQQTSAEFNTIAEGTVLTGVPIQHPKGWRLIEIRVERW